MSEPRHLIVAPFGHGVRFEFDDTVPDRFVESVRAAWAEVTDTAERIAFTHAVSLTEPAGVPGVIAQPDEAGLAEHIGAALTLAAVEAGKGRTLSIHASAVALLDGRVIAFAGRPGAGKSTLVSVAGRRYGYVTDETVAVQSDGTVLPFRKPVAIHAGGGWKEHRPPASIGMQPLPPHPLKLAGILLLDRDSTLRTEPIVEEVGFEEALSSMLPELSHFAALPRPLHYLAGLVDSMGGVRRLRYREAASVPPLLEEFAWPAPVAAGPPIIGPAPTAGNGLYSRAALVDWVDRDNVVLCVSNASVETLSGIAPTIWRALSRPASIDAITAAVVKTHGAPPEGAARALVAAILDELADRGLVTR